MNLGYLYFLAFALCIPAANWLIGNVGAACVPNGPCLVPVWFGVMAPSGVLMIGVALALRDLVQELLGVRWCGVAIVMGATLSVLFAPTSLAVASGVAFLFSELVDLAVYTPLRKNGRCIAIAVSGLVGATVDSAIFLFVAFGSLDHLSGQVVGKMWACLAVIIAIKVVGPDRACGGELVAKGKAQHSN